MSDFLHSLTALYDRVENSVSQDKSKVNVKKDEIATINKKQELTESLLAFGGKKDLYGTL